MKRKRKKQEAKKKATLMQCSQMPFKKMTYGKAAVVHACWMKPPLKIKTANANDACGNVPPATSRRSVCLILQMSIAMYKIVH